MKCSICKKPVREPGACRACLPFNMYFAFPTTPAEEERCRRLLVAHRSELESIPFSQAKIGAKGEYTPLFDGDDELSAVYDGDYMLMPGLDRGGRKSVLVGKKKGQS